MTLRDGIAEHPLLSKYFRVLDSSDLIPDQYRLWGRECPVQAGPVSMEEAWGVDEFVLDPCRLTIEISATGIDGDTFKHAQLMDRWGIQVNKTTRNTVLAMTNIGTTRTAVAHLLRALIGIAEDLEAAIGQLAPQASQSCRYPPGFPVLVPGQEFSKDILDFMDALDTKEIHGFDPVRGYRVFVQSALVGDSSPS